MTSAPTRYGCHNRAPYKGVPATQGGPVQPFRFAPDCQYTKTELGNADKRCDECRHKAT